GSGTLGWRPSNSDPTTGEGQGWDDLYATNVANGQSKGILRNSMNNHNWVGLLSTLTHSFNDNLKLMGGLDGRYYKGEHYREVRDLLGGTGYDDSKYSANDNAQVGDRVAYNNEATVGYIGAFAQMEYSTDDFSTFVTGTVSNTTYNRTDFMNYGIDSNGKSMYYKDINKQDGTAYGDIDRVAAEAEAVSNLGYTFKVGANYNINEQLNVFANTGYYSRAPFIQAVYLNYKNDVNPDLKNESIIGAEIGVGYQMDKLSVKANLYYTQWQDRFLRTGYQDDLGEYYTVNFTDLAETHTGVEIEINYQVLPKMDVGVFGSFGNWVYANDPKTSVLDENNEVVPGLENVIVALDGLKVADAPQTQIGLTWNYRFLDGFSAGANFLYFDNFYAAFDTASRIVNGTDEPDRDQSFQIPSYTTLDLRLGYAFQLAGLEWKANVNAYNVLDTKYMADGLDSVNKYDSNGDGTKTYGHGKENFKGFMGWGRNFNFSLRVSF
ncbi:MAG: TonB-dependent receptor, partial [Flavobacteriales bacterium]|nr:TonB-dependent receptor [Flavobacteriales bacterium]